MQLEFDRQEVKLFCVWHDQGTKLPVGPTLTFGLHHVAAFFCRLRLEGHNMKDQFVQMRVAGGGQDPHPAAHPTVHVLGPYRKMTDCHPQQARAGQVLESGWWFLTAFAVSSSGFGALFTSVMVHGQDAAIDGPQFDARAFNFR
jgi:hypothetical protein